MLSKAEQFYIDHHAEKLGIDGLVAELKVSKKDVVAYLKKNPGKMPKVAKATTQFMEKAGVVAMTAAQSKIGDDAVAGQEKKPYEGIRGVHVIDKDLPVH